MYSSCIHRNGYTIVWQIITYIIHHHIHTSFGFTPNNHTIPEYTGQRHGSGNGSANGTGAGAGGATDEVAALTCAAADATAKATAETAEGMPAARVWGTSAVALACLRRCLMRSYDWVHA